MEAATDDGDVLGHDGVGLPLTSPAAADDLTEFGVTEDDDGGGKTKFVSQVGKLVAGEVRRFHTSWTTPDGFAYSIPLGDFRDSLPPR